VLTRALWLTAALLLASPTSLLAAARVETPPVVHTGQALSVRVTRAADQPPATVRFSSPELLPTPIEIRTDEPQSELRLLAGVGHSGRIRIRVEQPGAEDQTITVTAIPGWLSVVPPLLAIVAAVALRQVVVALVAGLWLGAAVVAGYDPLRGMLEMVHVYVVGALADTDHASIIVFSMLLGGMVGVISHNGGTRGIVDVLGRFARTARSGQLTTFVMGLGVFFDDYANALIVGNTMRPVCDRLRISRAKLAYIVDSTSAPVASVALISTWIGTEVGLIKDALQAVGHPAEAYHVFLRSIPYRFYPLLALAMVLLVALWGRDFGPMLAAERRARREGRLSLGADLAVAEKDTKGRWWNAIVPIVLVLAVTLGGIWSTGRAVAGAGAGFSAIFQAGNSYHALLWGSFAGGLVAVAMTLLQRHSGLEATMKSWLDGVASMLPPLVVLTLAWGLQAVCSRLQTADYLVDLLSGSLAPQLVPLIIFVLAAVVSFATGTSWGTMPILMPIVVPLAVRLAQQAGLPEAGADAILVGAVSSVLAGSVFGDHCSPLSDTTILSAMASSVGVVEHVSTQLPYALVVAVVGMLLGDLPAAYGMNPLLGLLLGMIALCLILRFVGRAPSGVGGDL
jgi:Na+/H+ antiporter NhaC